jgi:signal transduction histidine kinase
LQQLVISPGPEEGPFLVLGERRLLDAVFSNLLKNAVEAAPEGAAIAVRLWVDTRQGSSLAMASVRNPGEVPEAIRRVFFEKFITSGKTGGTGLGTYSARLMVRTLGGTLALDTSEPGHTTLTVRLPHPGAAAKSSGT